MTPRDSCLEGLELTREAEGSVATISDIVPHTAPPGTTVPCLIVCGMHRSGTSLTASLLRSAGVHLGQELLPPDAWNPRGYFENRAFVDFHGDVLEANGLNRDGWDAKVPARVPPHMIERARQLIAAGQSRPVWGWKDPRSALFLEFWGELIPHSKFIITFRPPWEVVDSLLRRGYGRFREDPKFALEVWTNYCRLLVDFSGKNADRCLLFGIDQISRFPAEFIRAINSKFGMNLSEPDSEIFDLALLSQSSSISNTHKIVEHFSPDVLDLWNEICLLSSSDRGCESTVSGSEKSLSEIALDNWAVAAMLAGQQKRAVEKIDSLVHRLKATEVALKGELEASRKQLLKAILERNEARKDAEGRSFLDATAAFLSRVPVLKGLGRYLRFRQSVRLIAESGLFEQEWYVQQRPELKAKRVNAIEHYVRIGFARGLDPNPLFENNWYKEQNPGWERTALNPLEHYLRCGARDGRNPNRYFDTQWYLLNNLDVAEAGMNALRHYIVQGAVEGREPNPVFDTRSYLTMNPKVEESGRNPLAHFLRYRL